MRPLLLIDGDILLHETLAATEEETCWDEEGEVWSLTSNVKQAKVNFDKAIRKLRETLNGDRIVVCLSDVRNFRYDVLPTYKHNRKKVRKPVGFKAFKEWAQDPEHPWECILFPNLEADDVMGILGSKPGNEDAIIVSADKDMLTVPANIYRQGEVVQVSRKEADFNHLYQTLTGDTVDGYAGCPGIGPVGAKKILSGKKGDLWPHVVNAYRKAGLTEEDALVQAQVARICRWSDWDYDKKEVILWTP